MPLSPINALAHSIFPNWLKLKGANTVMSALERKDLVYFDPLWQQAFVTHNPHITTVAREPFRVAVVSLPTPKDMGDAHMVAIVVKKNEPGFVKYYLLEHDYVLATKQDRTLITERDGRNHVKHGEGPKLTGNASTDAEAFLNAVMPLVTSTPSGVLPR